mgnify:CR=1 FL=1
MKKIVIGIDVGISTTKIVGIDEDGIVVSPIRIKATDPITSLYGAFGKYLHDNQISLSEVEHVMLTGVGSAYIDEPIYGLPTSKSEEFVADGLGAKYESKLDRMSEVSRSDFDVSPEISDNSLPMLYQTGYLTIKGYNPEDDSYTLGYPNKEVKIGFIKDLLARYRSADGMSSSFVLKFNKALKVKNIDSALALMKSFLAGIPNDLENKTEKHYQTIIYLIFSLLGYYIQSEVKSAIGRADAVCRTKDRIYVFEFKVDGSAEDALKQIDDKGYLIPYKAEEGMELVKVGVNISTQTRTIDAWKEVVG